MSTDSTLTRRKLLGVGGSVALTSLSGCAVQQFNNLTDEENPNEYTEITDIKIRKTPADYNQDTEYFAVLSDDLQQEYGLTEERQVRIRIQASGMEQWRLRPAVYTTKIEPDFTSDEESTIWMSENGVERIQAETGMVVTMLPFATNPNITTIESTKEQNEFIEQSVTKDDRLLACASSGGQIYQNTELQALHISSESESSSWITAGFDDRENAKQRWHIRPELINPASYNDVRFLIDDFSFNYAVNFLGRRESGPSGEIYIGGLVEQEVQQQVAQSIRTTFEDLEKNVTVYIQQQGRWSGNDTQNIVNRFTDDGDNGIQIIQTRDIHTEYWREVAESVRQALLEDAEDAQKYDPSVED